jgi:TPR repeat protein
MPFRTHSRSVLGALLVCLLASAKASDRLHLTPEDDVDLAAGVSAYEARDVTRAAAAFRRAAERNQRTAQFNLAVMYFAGDGVAGRPAGRPALAA